jgi:2-iminoacetate synthase ThiH
MMGVLGNQGLCAFGFAASSRPIRRYLYTKNQLERLVEEVKRRGFAEIRMGSYYANRTQ